MLPLKMDQPTDHSLEANTAPESAVFLLATAWRLILNFTVATAIQYVIDLFDKCNNAITFVLLNILTFSFQNNYYTSVLKCNEIIVFVYVFYPTWFSKVVTKGKFLLFTPDFYSPQLQSLKAYIS